MIQTLWLIQLNTTYLLYVFFCFLIHCPLASSSILSSVPQLHVGGTKMMPAFSRCYQIVFREIAISFYLLFIINSLCVFLFFFSCTQPIYYVCVCISNSCSIVASSFYELANPIKPEAVEEWTDYGNKSKNHNHSLAEWTDSNFCRIWSVWFKYGTKNLLFSSCS